MANRVADAVQPAQMVKRLYNRYPFSASGTITDKYDSEIPAQVANISVGGCRLVTSARFSIGERITVRIRRDKDYFEAPANVAHCAEDGVGVMFHNETTQSLLVLTKWVEEAKFLEQINEGK